jgi:hypothetical protein
MAKYWVKSEMPASSATFAGRRNSAVHATRKPSGWLFLGCTILGAVIWLVSRSSTAPTSPSGPIPATFFGLQMHKPTITDGQPWPTVPFGAGRLWDSGVSWAELNKAQGVYDWQILDKWLIKYHEHGVDDLLYTFGRVPRWASSKPDDSNCAFPEPGSCDPPEDLKTDGTGPNQHWKDFVTALANHNKTGMAAHIRYWELWNEPYNHGQWTGTNAQLLRMARDARSIFLTADPSAVIVSPSSYMKTAKAQDWMEGYLRDGGEESADVIAVHGYVNNGKPGVYPNAAEIVSAVKTLRELMRSEKPIFDTEASWGRASTMGFEGNDEFESGFLAQFYLLQWSAGVSRFYWYAWNNQQFGTLWSPDPSDPTRPGHVHAAAIAYKQIYNWMVGATMNPACSASGDGIWSCGLTRPGSYEALVVWSVNGDKSYAPNARFKKLDDLSGNTSAITGARVNISFRPVLLRNQ